MADSGPPGPNQYQFDDLTVDTGKRLVLRDTSALEISGLTYDLLLAIVQAAPNIISADELVEKVWSGRPTSPETITQRAMMLRQGLGDSADAPRYIEVVRGQGFRLIPAIKGKSSTHAPAISPKVLGIGAVAIAAAIAVFVFWPSGPSPQVEQTIQQAPPPTTSNFTGLQRFSVPVEIEAGLGGTNMSAELALSPNGKFLAYTVMDVEKDTSMLYIRDFNEFEARLLPGTEHARRPFFSPDGRWIGFGGPNETGMRKIPVTGGSLQKLASTSGRNFGNTWTDDGRIIIATTIVNSDLRSHLVIIPSTGGEPTVLISQKDNTAYVWPEALPGSRHILFTTHTLDRPASEGDIGILSLDTLEHEILLRNAYRPTYLASGHLVFGRGSDLWAVRFDAVEAEVLGTPVRVASGIQINHEYGDIAYTASDNGLLAYVRGTEKGALVASHLYWADRNGNKTPLNVSGTQIRNPQISPAGDRIVISMSNENFDVWMVDIVRKQLNRITMDAGTELYPQWSQQGDFIFYLQTGGPGEPSTWKMRNADGSGEPTEVVHSDGNGAFRVVENFEDRITVRQFGSDEFRVRTVYIDGASVRRPSLRSEFGRPMTSLSPDGRWLAYSSNETDRYEIYVSPFPDVNSGKYRVSIDGGEEPLWSSDGSELFFRTSGGIWSADIENTDAFESNEPKAVVTGQFLTPGGNWSPTYDVTADGQRFLVMMSEAPGNAPGGATSFAFINNWLTELERLLPETP